MPGAGPGTLVLELGGQRLDPLEVGLGDLGQALAVVGVGLVEERQQDVPGLVVRLGQLAAQGVDQVGLLLLAERAIQIAGLLEVLLTLDRRLLGGAA